MEEEVCYLVPEDEILEILEMACAQSGSIRAFALKQGISPQYVYDALSRKRKIGKKLAEALGFKQRVVCWM